MRGFWTGMLAGAVVATAVTMWLRPGERSRGSRMKLDSLGRTMRRTARQALRRGSDFLEEALE